ncbi:MAG: hypothetical protein BWY57_03361 [Betaproteobacteria bacterium ADurb.Bin341]|nr:MAG: hypothetical protein BWY57_03361 [Betaproteobacteria bacterium ADurb.Bin341]
MPSRNSPGTCSSSSRRCISPQRVIAASSYGLLIARTRATAASSAATSRHEKCFRKRNTSASGTSSVSRWIVCHVAPADGNASRKLFIGRMSGKSDSARARSMLRRTHNTASPWRGTSSSPSCIVPVK